MAESHLKADIDIWVPSLASGVKEWLDALRGPGLFFQWNIGPDFEEDYDFDEPGIMACCEDDYDYPNTPQPDESNAEHGQSCALDCAQQACRSAVWEIHRQLDDREELLRQFPVGNQLPFGGDSYYERLEKLANYIAKDYVQKACFNALSNVHDPSGPYRWAVEGEMDVSQFAEDDPNASGSSWEGITDVVISGECRVTGWEQAPGGGEACEDLDDNEEEDPFGAGVEPGAEFKVAELEDGGPDEGMGYIGEGELAVAPALGSTGQGQNPLYYLPHLTGDGLLRVDWDSAQGVTGGVGWTFPTPPFQATHVEVSLIRIPDDCSVPSQPLAVDVFLQDLQGDVSRGQLQNFTIESTTLTGNPSSCASEERYTVLAPLSCLDADGAFVDESLLSEIQLRFGEGDATPSGTVIVEKVALAAPSDTSTAVACSGLGSVPSIPVSLACEDYTPQAFASYVSNSGQGGPVGTATFDGALGRFLAARPGTIAACDGSEYQPDSVAGFDVRSLSGVYAGGLLDLVGLQDGDAAITVNEPGKPASNAVELFDEDSFFVAARRFGALEELEVAFLREQSGAYGPVQLDADVPADLVGVSAPQRPAPPTSYPIPQTATYVSTTADLIAELASPVGQDIVLADGDYDWAGPVTVAGPHRIWAQSLHGATLKFGLTYAGNADRVGGLELHGLSFVVDDAAKAPFGVGSSHILFTWGQGGEDVLVEDCAFDGDLVIGNAIGSFAPNGLVVRRSTFDNFWGQAIFAKQGGVGTVLASEPLFEDLTIRSVFDSQPGSSGGVRENGILLGNNATVQRVDVRDVGWSGIQLYNDATGVVVRDVFVDYAGPGAWATSYTDPRGAAIWLSQAHDVTIERVRVETHTSMAVNLVWDGGHPNPFVNTAPPRNHDVLISDLYSRAYKIGVHMDFGVENTSVRSSRFEHSWMAGVLDNNQFEDDLGWYPCAGGGVCMPTTNRVDNVDCYLQDGVACVAHHHHGGASATPPANWPGHPDGYVQPYGDWSREGAASSAGTSGGADGGQADSGSSGPG